MRKKCHTDLFATNVAHFFLVKPVRAEQIPVEKIAGLPRRFAPRNDCVGKIAASSAAMTLESDAAMTLALFL